MPYTTEDLRGASGGGFGNQTRDQINIKMRQSPAWQNAIRSVGGFRPDGVVSLNKQQQQQVAQLMGIPTSDFHIDQAGNISDFHGWKGLPTAAKIAIIGGATAATLGAAGAFSGGAGAASAAGGGAGAGAGGGGGLLASSAIPGLAGAGAPGAVGGGLAAGGNLAALGSTAAGGASALSGGGEGMRKFGFGGLKKFFGGNSREILGLAGGFASSKSAADAERYKADMDDRRRLAEQIAKREEFRLNAPRTSAQQAAFGDFLSNYKPYVPSNMGPESTWAKPISGEGFGENARSAGSALGAEALRRLLEKDYNYQLPNVGGKGYA